MTRRAPDFGVVLAAAGSGSRFGAPKHLVRLGGKPLLLHSLEVFDKTPEVAEIVIVVPSSDVDSVRALVASQEGLKCPWNVVVGGSQRQESVLLGLRALSSACGSVLVHDVARPLVLRDDIIRVIQAVREEGAAVLGYRATDSVKEASGPLIRQNLARENIWLVQTPQGSRLDILKKALEDADSDGFAGTDETSFLERAGHGVVLVEGARDNIKVTYPEDLELAEFFLSRR